MKKGILKLETLVCPTCILKIEKAVKSVVGVEKNSVIVKFNASKVHFDYDDTKTSIDEIKDVIEKIGYQVMV